MAERKTFTPAVDVGRWAAFDLRGVDFSRVVAVSYRDGRTSRRLPLERVRSQARSKLIRISNRHGLLSPMRPQAAAKVTARASQRRKKKLVVVTDPAPTTDPLPTVDTTPPETTITAGPAEGSTVTDTQATFSFSASEPGTFQCRRDGGTWSTCLPPVTYSSLAVGAHSLEVRAMDLAGNTDPTAAVRNWSVRSVVTEGLFSATNRPSGTWRPFSDASAFNNRIPSAVSPLANSAQMVAFLGQWGGPRPLYSHDGSDHGRSGDYYHPIYYSQPSDPEFVINCTYYGGDCPIDGMRVRIPQHAVSAGGSDGHLHVWDQANGYSWDFFRAGPLPAPGSTLDVAWGRRAHHGGTGTDGGGSAAQFSGMLGKIRWEELKSAMDNRTWINHALFMVPNCTQPGFVYPATKGENKDGCPGFDRTHAPKMGQYFRLNMTMAEIDALPIPEWRKVIARTMVVYGGYVGDQGGNGTGGFGFHFESSLSYTAVGQPSPFVEFAKANPAGIWADGSGRYYFNTRDGVPWYDRLEALTPDSAPGYQ